MLLLTGRSDSYAQLITVLLVFCLVLALTAGITKWLADYQKKQGINCNIEVIETARISSNKFVQLVRVGDTYMAIAVCKDTVTMLGEIPADQLKKMAASQEGFSFRELLEKAVNKSENDKKPKE